MAYPSDKRAARDRLKGRVFLFLLNLRDSGIVNMYGAAPYLEDHFGLDRTEAEEWLLKWMRSFRD